MENLLSMQNLYLTYSANRKKLVQDQIILCKPVIMNFTIMVVEAILQPNLDYNSQTICKVGWWKTSINSNSK